MSIAIVFVHGAFCGGWAFDAFRKPFEDAGYETHAPNLPHHERGADLEALARCGVRDYAESIAAYAKRLDRPVVLNCQSLGRQVSQMAAARMHPAGLILIGSSAPWGVTPTTLDEHANSLGTLLLGDYWRRPLAPDFPTARRTTIDRLSRDDARRVFAKFVPESGRAVSETVHWWLDHSMASAVPPYRIDAPVLGLGGGLDRINPATTIRRIINRFPHAQADFFEFPDMSHWLIGEPEWPKVAATALDWMAARGLAARQTPEKKRFSLFQLGRV